MKGIIAIDEELSYMRDMLEEEGYEVVDIEEGFDQADAILVSGMRKDILGISDTETEVPIIDATGRQPEELLYDIDRHLNMME